MQAENFDFNDKKIEFSLADDWIQSEMQNTLQTVETELKNYRFDLATHAIYEFAWHQFCDWYLELAKPILNSDQFSGAVKNGTRKTLISTLEALLRTIHPFMPFITEEIWQEVAPKMGIKDPTIMLQKYPQFDATKINNAATSEIQWLKKIILAIRNIRGEMNISPAKPLPLVLNKGTETDKKRIKWHEQYLKTLAKLESIDLVKEEKIPLAATAVIGELELHIPLAGLIDIDAEIARLNKEIDKLKTDISRAETKLENNGYITKAPEEVVAKERTKLEENKNALQKAQERLEKLQEN
jgi:valyl-tRNA synthetase